MAARGSVKRPYTLVDGYNLTREGGTGVATYGRAFLVAAQTLGHEVGVLGGTELRRAALVAGGRDAWRLHHKPRMWPLWKCRRIIGSALAIRGFRAYRLPELDAQPDERLPQGVEVWNGFGVYAHAIGAFRKLGAFADVVAPGVDIAHWTYPLPLRVLGALNVYSIHDLVPLLHPELTLEPPMRYLRLARAVAARADHILTVSEASRRDIVAHLGVAPERVTSTGQPHGVSPAAAALAARDVNKIAAQFGLVSHGYLLFAGAIEPKKNIRRLLEAYFESGITTPLVLTGGGGWLRDEQLAPWRNRKGTPAYAQVRVVGHLPRPTLLALMAGARAVLLPSVTEGFGLPAAEAMALGAPVLASSAGGLPEVTGDAALTVDHSDPRSISAGLARIDGDGELRARLAAAGLARSATFSAAAYADRLRAVFAGLKEQFDEEMRGPSPVVRY